MPFGCVNGWVSSRFRIRGSLRLWRIAKVENQRFSIELHPLRPFVQIKIHLLHILTNSITSSTTNKVYLRRSKFKMVSPKQRKSLKLITNMFRRQRTQSGSKHTTKTKNDVLGGVYHTATQVHFSKALQKQDSSTSCSTVDTCSSESTDGDSVASSWTSSDSPEHHTGAPLLVRSVVSQRHLGSLYLSDEEVLGRIMIQSRNLPRAKDGYFASNHVLINNERTKRTMVPLRRSRTMDEVAREHASQMAKEQSLFHADPATLEEKIGAKRVGANVGKGSSVNDIHKYMMTSSVSDKNNVIDRRFVSMGVGTAKAADGTLYLCQIFSD
jgi:uncharacterized protein YkwD